MTPEQATQLLEAVTALNKTARDILTAILEFRALVEKATPLPPPGPQIQTVAPKV